MADSRLTTSYSLEHLFTTA